MIVVDTNIVSEPLKASPDPRVIAWLDAQPADTLFLTSISYAELLLGISKMPSSKRRAAMADGVDHAVRDLFGGRILPFDHLAAKAYAQIVADLQRKGRSLSMSDAQIAGTAMSLDFKIATRDKAFEHAGGAVINPWLDYA